MQVGEMDYWRKKREAQIKVSSAFSKAAGARGKAPGRAPQGVKYLLFSRGAQNAHSHFGIGTGPQLRGPLSAPFSRFPRTHRGFAPAPHRPLKRAAPNFSNYSAARHKDAGRETSRPATGNSPQNARLPNATHLPLLRSKSMMLSPEMSTWTWAPMVKSVLPNTTPVSRKSPMRTLMVDSMPVGMAP